MSDAAAVASESSKLRRMIVVLSKLIISLLQRQSCQGLYEDFFPAREVALMMINVSSAYCKKGQGSCWLGGVEGASCCKLR